MPAKKMESKNQAIGRQSHQIFNDTFEASWEDFDELFRKNLLAKIREVGSLHRLTLNHEEANTEFGRRFYEALEATLVSGNFLPKWKKALAIPMPRSFDELTEVFKHHTLYPLHAFYLLLLYIHEYPLRAFFSGRDKSLPYNTLTLKFQQELSDPKPTDVRYELEMINLDRCPGLAYDLQIWDVNEQRDQLAASTSGVSKHPQHHRYDLVWVWHFVSSPTLEI